MEAIRDGRAPTIMDVLQNQLGKYDVPWSRVVGHGSDGTRVMTGHMTGITARIQAKNPFCVAVHCVAHRLNLAVSQACNSVPDMQAIQRIISIYNFVQINRQDRVGRRFHIDMMVIKDKVPLPND